LLRDLFNDAICKSDYTASNGRVLDELERTWKEVIVATFGILVWYLSGRSKKEPRKSVTIADDKGWDLNQANI
jgi:hypothetical protein